MALKLKYGDIKEIPAGDERFYVERDGAWVLDLEGGFVEKGKVDEARAKLDEFRTNNVALLRQVEDLRKKYDGIDPDAVKAALEEKRKLEEEAALKAGEFDKVLEARLRTERERAAAEKATLEREREALNARLMTIQVDHAVISSAAKRGLRPTAGPDVTARARGAFVLREGVPIVLDTDGKTAKPGKDGVAPMTLDEWVEQLAAAAPHLFEGNAGGGASGNGSGGAAGGGGAQKNPFRKGADWNVTEQMRLLKTNPAVAERLRAAA